MKKNILIFTIILTILFTASCKEKSSKDLFKNFIPKNLAYYDFYSQNPLMRKYDIEDLNLVKNKVIKDVFEEFDIDSEGRIKYGDDYDKYIMTIYYFFNNAGEIIKSYTLVGGEEKLYSIDYDEYEYTKDAFVQKTTEYILPKNKTNTKLQKFKIEKQDNKIIATEQNLTNKSSVKKEIFEKDNKKLKITVYSVKSDSEDKISEITYDRYIEESTSYSSGKLYSKTLYENNKPTKKIDKNGKEVLLNDEEQQQIPEGYLSYTYYHPKVEGSPGSYRKYTIQILDKPDELLLKYFPELKE